MESAGSSRERISGWSIHNLAEMPAENLALRSQAVDQRPPPTDVICTLLRSLLKSSLRFNWLIVHSSACTAEGRRSGDGGVLAAVPPGLPRESSDGFSFPNVVPKRVPAILLLQNDDPDVFPRSSCLCKMLSTCVTCRPDAAHLLKTVRNTDDT